MDTYSSVAYPGVLAVMAIVLVAGGAALVSPRLGGALPGVAWVARVATVVEVLVIAILVITGSTHPSLFTLVGYLLSALVLLGLFGISRLGAPPEPGQPHEADRPVLSPRQSIQVDAVAAMIVAVALAVVAWRLHAILIEGVPL